MRFTFSQYREVARTGGAGWRPPRPGAKPIGTYGTRNKAVRLFHEESLEAAVDYLEGRGEGKGLTGYFGPSGRRARQGALTRQGFDYYADQAERDQRPWIYLHLSQDVPVGSDSVNVLIDVVLHDVRGYVGRLLLWDSTVVCTTRLARRYAAPCFKAIDTALGTAIPVAEMEVWHLHDQAKWIVGREEGIAALSDAELALRHAVEQLPE